MQEGQTKDGEVVTGRGGKERKKSGGSSEEKNTVQPHP